MSLQSRVSLRLTNLMRLKGITQQELARRANITAASVSQIICQKRLPGLGVAARLADALDSDMNYICGFDSTNRQMIINNQKLNKIKEIILN